MAFLQLQRVHRYANGEELVVDFINAEVCTHREYGEHLATLAADCGDDEFTRTVAEGAPLYVRTYTPVAGDLQ